MPTGQLLGDSRVCQVSSGHQSSRGTLMHKVTGSTGFMTMCFLGHLAAHMLFVVLGHGRMCPLGCVSRVCGLYISWVSFSPCKISVNKCTSCFKMPFTGDCLSPELVQMSPSAFSVSFSHSSSGSDLPQGPERSP